MKATVENIVAVWTVLGWVIGATMAIVGLGLALWGIFDRDAWQAIQGAALVAWGWLTVHLGVGGSAFLVKTFIQTPKP